MTNSVVSQFAAVFAPSALTGHLPLRVTQYGFEAASACSLACAAQLCDRLISGVVTSADVAIELLDPFAGHDVNCDYCGKRIN